MPTGVPGELYVGGPGVTRGYLSRPELTAERFLADPFSPVPEARMYRTGDLVRFLSDGSLEFLGRVDQQVKVRGFRIELGEIESVLRQHAAVDGAVVLARQYGAGDTRLVAYLVPVKGQAPQTESLRSHLRERLPDFMVPSAFVPLESFPLSPNGKVDRKALTALDVAPQGEARDYEAPRTPTEERIASLWAQVLQMEKVGRQDDFFALGGHSLLATRVASRLRADLGVEVPLRALFEAPTVAALAARLDAGLRESPRMPPLRPMPREGALPLSFAQQRLWFIDRLEPGSTVYNVPSAVMLEGELDASLLRQALEALVLRHESLRTTFGILSDEPVQVILPHLDVSLPIVDLSAVEDSAREAELKQRITQEVQRTFDLERGPLLRALLLRLSPQRHVLVLTLHHVISDGWSMGVLIREVGALYSALASGQTPALPALPVQYADYAAWQRAWLQGPVLQAQLDYWRQQLSGAPALLELPTDRPRPAVQSYRGAVLPLHLPAQLASRLNALARQHGATPFMVLLAAWQLLLSRYSGQQDVSVGSPIAGRTRAELEGLIGFFVNTLVLRSHLSPQLSFQELLAQVKTTTLGAYEHQDVPFEKLVEELRPERSLSYSPLFQVMFVLQNTPTEPLQLPGVSLRPLELEGSAARFDLSLELAEHSGGFSGRLEYNTDLFDSGTVARMAEHFGLLLESIASEPQRPLATLPLLRTEERHTLLEAWNGSRREVEWEGCWHERIERRAALTPDNLAVLDDERALTFSELNRRANQLAWTLRARGVGPESRVGLCLERSVDMVVAILAILKAGGAYVPMDPTYPAERLSYMVQDSRARWVLTQQRLAGLFAGQQVEVFCMDTAVPAHGQQPESNPPPLSAPQHLAYVIYTSGSTGRPKGVMVQHASVMNLRAALAATAYAGVDKPLRVSVNAPLAFDASVQQLIQLADGHTLCVVPQAAREDASLLVAWLDRHAVEVLDCAPSHLRLLMEEGLGAHRPLRVLVGGEAVDEALWDQLSTHPHIDSFNVYGPTECTVDATVRAVRGAGKRPTLGGPLANVQTYVLDAYMNPAPVGVPGELYLGGDCLARGYLDRPELTAERFVPNPFSTAPGSRLYRTGDRARWLSHGELEYLGRIDHQVKLRGFRIELGEIESALRQHPEVRGTLVLVREDVPGLQRLVAYVVHAPGELPDVAALRVWLQKSLPEYMVPSAFVLLESMPLTSNGKVDRKALPAPEGARNGLAYVAPRTPLEERLAGIFAQVLRLERIGIHDDFFALGGHSLLATQLVSRVRRDLGTELPLRAIFEAHTVAALAERLQEGRDAGSTSTGQPPLRPVPRDGALPLSFAQQRLWVVEQLTPGSAAYNNPAALRINGALDVRAMEQGLSTVVNRHEALRTTFREEGEVSVQIVHPPAAMELPLTDLSTLPEAEREATARRLAVEEAHRPFDLRRGPLFRAHLLRLAPEHHVLLVTMHHIVSDGWSVSVLVREVVAGYEAATRGQQVGLPPLPVQYADYAAWQREWMQGPVLDARLDYWREQLAGAPAALELPTDRPRPAVQTYRGAFLPVRFPADLSRAVADLARRHGATPFMVLLATWQLLLSRYSGQQDVSVGSPIAGRTRPELEGLIGFFVNTLVFRSRLPPELTFRELLAQVKGAALGAAEHQDVPFEKLVEVLQPARNPSRSPFFQVTFTLQNTPPVRLELPGLSLRVLETELETVKFDLSLVLEESPEGLGGALNYNTDLFDASTAGRMMGHYRTLLEAIVAGEDRRLGELPLLTASEREQLLVHWNATSAEFPRDTPLHALFSEQAARTPDAVALIRGEEQLTYGELERRSNQLAHHLRAYGVMPGTRVGLCLERSVDLVVGLLGILKAGGGYVPIDHHYPAERISLLIQEAGVGVIVTQEALADTLPSAGLFVCLDSDADLIAGLPDGAPPASAVGGDDLAYVMFTSGSTGRPKGVCIPHRAVTRLVLANPFIHFGPEEVFLQLAPVAFDASTLELWGALLHGARLVLAPPHTPSLEELGALLTGHGITTLWLTAALFEQVVLHQGEALARVRQVLAGGDVLPAQRVRQHLERLPEGAVLVNGYGPTENTTFSATHTLRAGAWSGTSVPIGRPLGHSTAYVLDSRMEPVPVGVPGELYVGGHGLAWGYLNQPELTAEKFVPHPLATTPGERLYRTGDRVRWRNDGTLEFLGRTDFQVKVRGFRIELGEIESVLRQSPDVQEAVVLAREDSPGDKRLVAYVVGTDGPESVEPRTLREHLLRTLPEYMVPAVFIPMEALPLSPNGKVDRKALPAPDADRTLTDSPFEAPRDATEQALAAVWSEVLGVRQVGIDDSFYDLGGDSIRSIQVVARLRERGLELPILQLLQHPTIRELSGVVKATSGAAAPASAVAPFSLVPDADRARLPGDVEDAYPLATLQTGMLFESALDPSAGIYHDMFSFHLEVELREAPLRQAFEELLARHTILRTSFHLDGYEEPLQLVHRQITPPLHLEDIRHLEAARQGTFLREWAEAERRQPFDWSQAPLLRLVVHRRTSTTLQLTVIFHHAILDGWSAASLLSEMLGRYLELLEGNDAPAAPPPAATYRQFVALEREALHSAQSERFWLERMEGAETAGARPHLAEAGERVLHHHMVRIPKSLQEALQRVAHDTGVTLRTVLLAAHLRVRGFLAGSTSAITGIVTNGRPEVIDGERMIGLFLNSVPFPVALGGGTWVELIREVAKREQELLPHRRYPMARLKQKMGGQPLFHTLFNFVHFHVAGGLSQKKGLRFLDDRQSAAWMELAQGVTFTQDPDTSALAFAISSTGTKQEAEQTQAVGQYYLRALEALASHPHGRYEQAALLPEPERHTLLEAWNGSRREVEWEGCWHERIERRAALTPDRVAVLDDERALTFSELNRRANQLAWTLRARGVGPESRVGLCMERSGDMLVALLGILKAGGAYVPMDPSYPAERLSYMVQDSRAGWVLTQQRLAGLFAGQEVEVFCMDTAQPAHGRQPESNPPPLSAPQHLAYVIYTSGSTGRPKGVMVQHASVMNLRAALAATVYAGVNKPLRVSVNAPLAFDASVKQLIQLADGHTLCVVPQAAREDTRLLLAWLERHGVEVLDCSPSHLRLLMEEGLGEHRSLRVLVGGEAVDEALWARLSTHPHIECFNVYGPTECTVDATVRAVRGAGKRPTLGGPLTNVQTYVLDAYLNLAPVGVPGELYIGGAGLARGYLGRPELTAERFVPNPFSTVPGARLYRTGDRARWLPDGEIEYLGRIDHQVKLRGFRIELGEIESALRQHPEVRDTLVLVREDVPGLQRLVAYVVHAPGEPPDVAELRAWLKKSLPEYMVPSAFVLLESMPLTSNGKVDRKALPTPEGAQNGLAYVAPSTPLEERLAGIFARVLQVERVGRQDDFFALGGHSLLATQLVSRVRRDLGTELPLRALFEAPTVAALATRLEAGRQDNREQLPLRPVPRDGALPLSFAQQRLWFIDRLEPGSSAYNIPSAVMLDGELDTSLLRQALEALVLRHESLRTTFDLQGDEPVQVIHPRLDIPLPIVDLSEAELKQRITQEVQRTFNLESGPLLRALLLRLSPQRHVLVLTLHHSISDGWSMGVLVREVGALYSALASGQTPALPSLPVQYADYAAWQRAWLQGPVLQAQLDYWRQQLSGAPALLELPTDRPRPSVQSSRGAALPLHVPAQLASRLNALARQHGATPFMLLLAAWQLLLSRYSGQQDVSVGSPIAGRTRAELEGLIGFFVNTLVLRSHLSPQLSFQQLLAQVKATTLGAYEHQDVPFEKLVEELRPERSLSYSPLFQVMFVLQNTPTEPLRLPGVSLRPLELEGSSSRFDLSLGLAEHAGGFSGHLEYNTDLFDSGTAARLAEHFLVLLESIAREPQRPIATLPLLRDEEHHRLLVEWNDTRTSLRRGVIPQLIAEQVARTPEATALVCGEERLSYRQLDSRANQLAHHLLSLGVGPEVRVAVCMERSAQLLVSLLAVLKAGGAYVPLDPDYPRQRLDSTLLDSGARLLLSHRPLLDSLQLATGDARVVCLDALPQSFSSLSTSTPTCSATEENLAYVIYTSGSTGRPKGVAISHASATAFLDWATRTFSREQLAGTLAATSICFDLSIFELFAPLTCGGTVLLARDALALASLPAAGEVTLVNTVPSAIAELLRLGAIPPSVRTINLAGEPLPGSLVRGLYATGTVQHVFNLYGPTEDTTYSTFTRVPEGPGEPTIGVPLPQTSAYVLSPQLELQPIGVPGELYLAGAGLARGYLGRPELSAERFLPDLFSPLPGARMYRTGDLARRLPNGQLEYLGRIDHQVKVRGFRIELGEIESVLRQHASVEGSVVLARQYPEGDKRLVAYVVPVKGSVLEPEALRAHLRERLPDFMVPASFMVLESFPLTPNGKVDRKALPAPDAAPRDATRTYEAPRTPTEELLASLWAQVLQVERVGRQDDFFALGGHSLLATRIVSRIRAAFGVEVPLRALFEAPTVAALATRLEAGRRDNRDQPPLRPMPRDGALPLSFAQQRLWFIDRLEPGSTTYNIPSAVMLDGELDASLLRQALEALVLRHESLRTTFDLQGDEPVQVIHPRLDIPLPIVDLSEAELKQRITQEVQRTFNLEHGPLLRALLLRLSPQRHVLVLTVHHSVSDGWSMGVLVREVGALYSTLASGQTPALPSLPVQYADYAAWQRAWLQGPVLQAQLDYWRQQLSGAPALLELPTDRPRPSVQSSRGAALPLHVPAQLASRLNALARQHGATPFMLLLAAWQLLLSRYSGQQDVSVGSPIAGRTRAELEGLIGFFVNTLVLRSHLSPELSFQQLLAQVKATTLGAYEHQDVPFEKLVEELRPERSLSYSPLFQVMFVLQNTPAEPLRLPGVSLRPLELEGSSSRFDLSLGLAEHAGGFSGHLEYNTDLFDSGTAARLAEHFLVLLESIAREPQRPIATLPLLRDEEHHRLLVEWNDTRTSLRRSVIPQLIAEQVARTPEATALVCGEERLSYRQLDSRANQLAHHLLSLGVGPEVRVAVCMERSSQLLVSLLAILKAGGAYVPLDPDYPRQRLDSTLLDSGARLLLSHRPLLDSLQLATGDARVVCLDALPQSFSSLSTSTPTCSATEENLAYVIYTSGSTGRPKGVAISHASATAFLDWSTRTFSREQLAGTLAATSICFDLSVFELFAPLTCGGTVLLARDALALANLPAANEVTLVNTVPSAIAELLRLGAIPPSVRTINLAGEPLPGSLVRGLYATGTVQHVFNLYGPTEDTTYSTFTRVPEGPGEPTIGVPLPQTSAYVLSPQLELQPIGVPGELYLAGAGLARGYLGRPELSAERFLPDLFSPLPGARMYRTGDLARRLPNGQLEYLGRIDHQVKVRGFRIELGEIESVLRQHASVEGSVVLARQYPEGDKRLVAYVVPVKGSVLEPEALRAHLRERLPDFMVPASFMVLESFPLTPNGKVDRKALPAPEGTTSQRAYVPPRDAYELELARIFEELLGVSPVSARSDFFELGGHSLLAVRLVSTLRARTGRTLPVSALFQAPTVEGLAALLRHEPAPWTPLVPIQRGGSRVPFFCVHPVGGTVFCYTELARRLGPEQPFYGLQAQGLEGTLPPHESIEAMAASYVDAIRAVQPQGPYRLGGWSLGAVVAFEMARLLRLRGETVDVLALIEPSPTSLARGAVSDDDATSAALFALDLARTAGISPSAPSELPEGDSKALLERLLKEGREAGLLIPDAGLEQLHALLRVFTANRRALQRYTLGTFPGALTVLRGRDTKLEPSEAEDRGWGGHAAELKVREIPGDHYTVLRAPEVDELARALADLLERANA
ncbi:non-ribosomal peptide synthase/polyketide synthase [Archangium lansingense]|uniref:non-ribosomal peptide synthase/polyketide synthase n=1 Tax=Archangium lansingense TaxID=2995310 RepID=UPI003B7CC7B3